MINDQVGDLTAMAKEIEKVMMKHLKLKEKPAIVLSFTCEHTGFSDVHWVLNINRPAAVGILKATADKLTTRSN